MLYTIKTPHGIFTKTTRNPVIGVSVFKVRKDWHPSRFSAGELDTVFHRTPFNQRKTIPFQPWGDYLGTFDLDGNKIEFSLKLTVDIKTKRR